MGDIFLVRRALEEHHVSHELYVARDGAEALAFLSSMGHAPHPPCPDLMLLDVNLPKVDGHDVLSEFRKRPECARTPVIVVTSSDAPRDRARLASLGITRYFKKPSDYDAFLKLGALVREVITDNRASEVSISVI